MSDDNVTPFPGTTMNDIPVGDVLEGVDEGVERVMVIGWTEDGQLWISSSFSNGAEMIFLLEVVKAAVLRDLANI